MPHLTWRVSSGTGMLGHVGPIHFEQFTAHKYYGRLLEGLDIPRRNMECMRLGGILRLAGTFEWFEKRFHALKGQVGLIGHSQPCSHFVHLAARNPEKFPVVISIAGDHFGSLLATKRLLDRFPCSRDLSPESAYLQEVRAAYARMVKTTPKTLRPRVVCVAAYRDAIVLPWHSSLLPDAENYVFSRRQPDKLPHGAIWIPTRCEPNHFNVVRNPELIGLLARLKQGPLTAGESPPGHSPQALSPAKAA